MHSFVLFPVSDKHSMTLISFKTFFACIFSAYRQVEFEFLW